MIIGAINGADTAWILTSTALVLLMTLPGLALFYGGLVRASNLLSVLMHCVAVACLVSVLWLALGYTLAFGEGNAFIGDLGKAFLSGVGVDSVFSGAPMLPETVFFMFQMTFAIITPALIIGAYVERIKFSAVLIFSGLWLLVVYAPVTHWIWGGGFLQKMGVMDFAGGLVVHLTAGVSSLVIVMALGARKGFPNKVAPPHAPWMTMVGACLLWVGWFGFNGGSALAAGGGAGMAILVTHISAATASLVWMAIEWGKHGKPSLVGIVTGTIGGLATVTPASGFIGPLGGLILGLVGGFGTYYMVNIIRDKFNIDDTLDVFAVHGFGGLLGILIVPFLAIPQMGGLGLAEGQTMMGQFWIQLQGSFATAVWSILGCVIIILVIEQTVGLRVSEKEEREGLDSSYHGEKAYHH